MSSKHVPLRRCVGCMESKPKETLFRFVRDEAERLGRRGQKRPAAPEKEQHFER